MKTNQVQIGKEPVIKMETQEKERAELSSVGNGEDRYKHFFYNNLDLACFANVDGYFEELNDNFTKVLGYTTKDLLNKKFFEFIHPDDVEPTKKMMKKLSVGIDTILFVNRFRTKSSSYKYLEWSSTVNLETKKIYAVARDITRKVLAEKEFALQQEGKEKAAAELIIANKELSFQHAENEKRAAELVLANEELAFQNNEKGRRAAELDIANKELAFQNREKEKRADEAMLANKELAFQNEEKAKRAAELIIANKELDFQNKEKEKRAAELLLANQELVIQNKEKEKKAAELVIANHELVFQHREKERRADELILANKELAWQNTEKGKRAEELVLANEELAFQNAEKEKRAAELVVANKELEFQNYEKGKRAEELIASNNGLKKAENDIFNLNEELERKVIERTAQLEFVNKELESFSYSVSHDLRAPLRAISGNARILQEDYAGKFDADGSESLESILSSANKMGNLIDDLLAFSKLGRKQVVVSEINMNKLVKTIIAESVLEDRDRIEFKVADLPSAKGDPSLIKQVWVNLISNAIKYSKYKQKAFVEIGAYEKDNRIVYHVRDNGAGFSMKYYDKLFGVFQRLHSQEEFEGTGIGLAIVQKVVSRHSGTVWAESKLNEGACFYFSLSDTNS